MGLSRIMLLITGIVSSVAVATVMYISADGALFPYGVSNEVTELTAPAQILPEEMLQAYTNDFPMPVAGTTLVAKALAFYDGRFLEDGSDREVINVLALEVQNVGNDHIRKAHIELKFTDMTLNFLGEHIPSGGKVLLIERNCAKSLQGEITDCAGWQFASASVGNAELDISASDSDLGLLSVTNHAQNTVFNVEIFFKSWVEPPGMYVGGVAHCVKIEKLAPGETVYLQPNYYVTGYSKVVFITGVLENRYV